MNNFSEKYIFCPYIFLHYYLLLRRNIFGLANNVSVAFLWIRFYPLLRKNKCLFSFIWSNLYFFHYFWWSFVLTNLAKSEVLSSFTKDIFQLSAIYIYHIQQEQTQRTYFNNLGKWRRKMNKFSIKLCICFLFFRIKITIKVKK